MLHTLKPSTHRPASAHTHNHTLTHTFSHTYVRAYIYVFILTYIGSRAHTGAQAHVHTTIVSHTSIILSCMLKITRTHTRSHMLPLTCLYTRTHTNAHVTHRFTHARLTYSLVQTCTHSHTGSTPCYFPGLCLGHQCFGHQSIVSCPIVLGSSSGDCSPLSQELSRGHASGGVRLYLGDAHWGGLLMPTQVRGTWGLGAHPTYGTSDGLMQPWAERRASCSPPHWRGPTSTSLRS